MRKKIRTVPVVILLLISIFLPLFSEAMAEDARWLPIEITRETEVLDTKANSIGTLLPDMGSGVVLQLKSDETIAGVQVNFLLAGVDTEAQSAKLSGKTKVYFSLAPANPTPVPEPTGDAPASESNTNETAEQPYAEPTPEPTTDRAEAKLPSEGWIDTNVVLATLITLHELDQDAIAERDALLEKLTAATPTARASTDWTTPLPQKTLVSETQKAGAYPWIPYAAMGAGVVAIGMLGWIAFSIASALGEANKQSKQLSKLAESLTGGLVVKSPLKVEQTAWPQDGRVQIASDTLDHIASIARQDGATAAQTPQALKEPEPVPIREGEEPDLLALANSLAGTASAAEWYSRVQEAGFYARLLQSNPTEKGTFIVDESGYSILACLMRSETAELAYVVPSYQDPKASEPRWNQFFVVNEDNVEKSFRIDTLPVMFVEHGVFFLPKTKGRLTRRVQYY